jgi:hypothetical protein
LVHDAISFIPTGYTPARNIPVKNRSTNAVRNPTPKKGMETVASPARIAEIRKQTRGEVRSAKLINADPNAPATNPIWTDIVSQALPASPNPHAAVNAGTTADAENHTLIANSDDNASNNSVGHFDRLNIN